MIQYFDKIDKYLPAGEPSSQLDTIFDSGNNAFCYLDFDTEYETGNQLKLLKPSKRLPVSTQVACLSRNPVIYSQQPRHRSHHQVSDLLDYCGILPSQIVWEPPSDNQKRLTLVIAGHFLTVELDYIFNGQMADVWRDKYLTRSGYVDSTKRVMENTEWLKRNPAKGLLINEFKIVTPYHTFGLAIKLVDTAGLQGMASYKDLLMNSGFDIDSKELADLCKLESGCDNLPYIPIENMSRTITDFPESFDRYAKNDLRVWDILQVNHSQMLEVKENLGIPPAWSKVTSLTSGAAVADLLEKWLAQKAGLDYSLNPKTGKNKNSGVLQKMLQTSPNTIFNTATGTDALLVKTFGGRCVNNRPTVKSVNGVLADADEDGCYGNGQKHQDFPLGSPDIMAYPLKQGVEYKSLRQWLKDYQDDLVPGLWHAIVDTQGYTLKHPQDFFPSWIASQKEADYLIYKRLAQKLIEVDNSDDVIYDESDFSNEGRCKILLREVRCGVLTHDGLQWILKTASKHQRAEILDNFKVITSAVFLKSMECDNYQDYKAKTRQHGGKIKHVKMAKGSAVVDKTSRYWFRIPLADLMHPLSRERKKYPKKDPNLGGKRHPMNDRNKLVINTNYGVSASSFFKVSNPVVGNNITARARAMGWYMEKACQAFGIITDGSVFDINNVVLASPSRPLTGSNCIDGVDTRIFKLAPLGGLEVRYSHTESDTVYFTRGDQTLDQKELEMWLNTALADHVGSHFPDIDCVSYEWVDRDYKAKDYQIVSESEKPMRGYFAWEMKGIYQSVNYHGTSNYKLTDFKGVSKYKMRSYNTKTHWDSDSSVVRPPSHQFLDSLEDNLIDVPGIFFKEEIINLTEFQANSVKYLANNLTVGDTKIRTVFIKPLSLSQFKFNTVKQLNAWTKQKDSVSGKLGWYLEGLFYDSDTRKIDYQAMIDAVDKMVREGVTDPLKAMGVTVEDIPRRPNFDHYLQLKAQVSVVKSQVKLVCPKCGSDNVKKIGLLPSGSQRYQCNECAKKFSKKVGLTA